MQARNRPYTAMFIALLLGAAMPFAFAPFNFWWLAFIAFSGWLYLLSTLPKHSLKIGFMFGFGWFGFGGYWLADTIHTYGHLPYAVGWLVVIGLGIVLASFITLWAWLFAKLYTPENDGGFIVSRILDASADRPSFISLTLLFPSLGVLEEWLRSFVFTGLP